MVKKMIFLFLLFISLPTTSLAQQGKFAFDDVIRSHQKIIIGNNNETIDDSKFISLEEYLENRNETSFQSQNLQKDYDALLDRQNQGSVSYTHLTLPTKA